jgi:hypothetical protein
MQDCAAELAGGTGDEKFGHVVSLLRYGQVCPV